MTNLKQNGSKSAAKTQATGKGTETTAAKAAANALATKPVKPEEKAIGKRQFPPDTQIKVRKQSNPFRKGSNRHQVLEILLGCTTVGQAREKCAGKGLKREPSVRALGRAVEKGIIELNVTAGS